MDKAEQIEMILDDLGYKADADGLAEIIQNNKTYSDLDHQDGTATAIEQMAEDFPKLFEIEQPDIPTYKGDRSRKGKKKARYFPGIRKHNQNSRATATGKDKGRQKATQRHKKRMQSVKHPGQ